MSRPPLARDQLNSLIQRLTAPDVEPYDAAMAYREARELGFDVTILRQVVRYAKMDPADAKESWNTLVLYMTHSVLA